MIRIARYSGLSAALVALVVVISWVSLLNGTSTVAFADVLQKVKEARSVRLVCKQKFRKQPEMSVTWSIQGDHVRMEYPGQMINVADLKKGHSIQIIPSQKLAYRSKLTKDAMKPSNNILYQLRNLRSDGAKRRGDEKVNGKNALVYEFDDLDKVNLLGLGQGEGLLKIWVDPTSKLPVKIVISVNTNGNVKDTDRPFDTILTLQDFEWNKEFDSKIFSLDIPKGYTVKEGVFGQDN